MDWNILCFVFSHVWFVFSHVWLIAFYFLFQPKLCRPIRPRTASEDPLKVKRCQIVEKSANANPAMSKPPQIWAFSWLTTLIWCHFLPYIPSFSHPAAPPAGSLVEDIGEMILQLRRQVENLFSIKFGTLACRGTAQPSIRKWRHLCLHIYQQSTRAPLRFLQMTENECNG